MHGPLNSPASKRINRILLSSLLLASLVHRDSYADRRGQFAAPLNPPVATSGTLKTYAVNSLIIPMDTDYQDAGVFLAYGLIYKLLSNGVPVDWIIKADKRLSTIAAVNGASESGTTATYTTTDPHNLSVGEVVMIAGVGVPGYNGPRTVASVVSATQFTATLGVSGLGSSGNGLVMPPDFTASASDKQGGPVITNHSYRGGSFVIDQADVAVATPIVNAWQTARPTTKVHVATASFTANVARSLVAAPRIAVFNDGNAAILFSYLNAAAIPDSQGNAWSTTSVDLLSPTAVAGATTTNHRDGALFDGNGVPQFSLLASPHYNASSVNVEAIAEAGEYLKSRTLLIAECQSVRSFEDNGHFITDQGMTSGLQPATVDHYFSAQPIAQDDGIFATVGGTDPSFAPTGVYSGSEGVDYFRIIRGRSSPNPDVVILGNAFHNAAGGRVMYLGGHQYAVTLPLSANPTSHGVRYFLNALLFAPSTARGDGIGDLGLTVDGPTSSVKAPIDYTITYQNSGAGVCLGTQISVPIPSGMTASIISAGGIISGGQIVWNFGNIDAGRPTPVGTLSFRLTASGFGNFAIHANGSYKRGITPASTTSGVNTSYALSVVPARLANGQVQLNFFADPALSYDIQASTDLINWVFLATVTSGDGNFSYVDTQAASFTRRFYRVAMH